MIPLTKLSPGKEGILTAIEGTAALQSRLARLGLIIDRPIMHYATSPFGGGCIWRQGSLLIALRHGEAECLWCREASDE